MNGTVRLTSKRLVFRKETIEDIPTLFKELGCNPEITRYTGWNPYTTMELTAKKVQQDIANYNIPGCYSWIIEFQNNIIGTIGAYDYHAADSSIEIGYSIFQSSWSKGFASEAIATVVEYLVKSEKIHTINAWCHSDNSASIKVLGKGGFKIIGIEKQAIKNCDASLSDRVILQLVEDESESSGF